MPRAKRKPTAAEELRALGLRATGPRLAILEYLRTCFSHPTPETVLEALQGHHASLSLSTVYQTLESFLQAGLCRRVAAASGRLRVDGTLFDHDHAVCRHCGEVFDLQRPAAFRPPRAPGLPRGTELVGVRLEYEVICPRCAGEPPARRIPGKQAASSDVIRPGRPRRNQPGRARGPETPSSR